MNFWVVPGCISLHEWIVSDSECQTLKTLEFELEERIWAVDYRVLGLFVFLLDAIDVSIECLCLLRFELLDSLRTFHHFFKLAGKVRDLALATSVEDEVHDSLVRALDEARLGKACLFGDHVALDAVFLLSEHLELVFNQAVEHPASML